MKVNYLVDNRGVLKFLGSSTGPKYYYDYLRKKIDIQMNGSDDHYDIIHVHSITPWSIMKAMKYKKRGAKLVHTVHSTINTNEGNTIGSRSLERKYYNWAFRKHDYLLAVSELVKKDLERDGFKNVELSYNAINTKFFKKNERLGKTLRNELNIDKKIVLNVAQVNPRKGVYDFINIAKRNPELHFIWVGGTPFSILTKDYFKVKRIMSKEYENITFYGYVDDIRKAYSAADIFLTPSYNETFGLTIIEAASSGLPVIVRDLIVYKKLFKNNVLYSRNNNEFVKNIKLLLNNDKLVKRSLRIKNKFDINKQGKKLLKFYKSILTK